MYLKENLFQVRVYINKIMLSMLLSIFFIFSISNAIEGNQLLFLVESAMCVITVMAIVFYKKINKSRFSIPFALIYSSLILFLFSLLLLDEMATNSSFAWVCLIPIITYTINGFRYGFWITIIALTYLFCLYLSRSEFNLQNLPYKQLLDYILITLSVWLLTHTYEKKMIESANKLIDLSTRDPLTNLQSRSRLYQIYKLYAGKRVCLVFFDVDGLKSINEKYGHLIGDVILISIANILHKSQVDDKVYAFRTGGDEFVLFIKDAELDFCNNIGKAVYETISACKPKSKSEIVSFHISMSMSCIDSDGNNLDKLMAQAETLVKTAKLKKEAKIALLE